MGHSSCPCPWPRPLSRPDSQSQKSCQFQKWVSTWREKYHQHRGRDCKHFEWQCQYAQKVLTGQLGIKNFFEQFQIVKSLGLNLSWDSLWALSRSSCLDSFMTPSRLISWTFQFFVFRTIIKGLQPDFLFSIKLFLACSCLALWEN